MYYSTKDKSLTVSFSEAIIQGLAPDGGLFMPEKITPFPKEYFDSLKDKSLPEMSFDVAKQLIGDAMPVDQLKSIVENTVNFDVPLVQIDPDIYALELFHGPTLAFKDFGARFLAGVMGHLASNQDREIVVLAATSGDTGSAVANGFYKIPGVRVVILYPSKKVSPLQELQLTTLGHNITAWEVDGTFDDCQRLVKQMFLDNDLRKKYLLTSANSINLGRLIPQTFYYFWAWSQLNKSNVPFVVSVPSGNFGNLTAGVIAKRLGLPIDKFIASTNANDIVPAYLASKVYRAAPSKQTISNAMDVGDPSNFARLLDLYGGDHAKIKSDITGFSFTDEQTRDVMKRIYLKQKYVLDPHGAVGYLGLRRYLDECGGSMRGVFLETAHPGKFHEVVEETLDMKLKLPEALEVLKSKKKVSVSVSTDFDNLKSRL